MITCRWNRIPQRFLSSKSLGFSVIDCCYVYTFTNVQNHTSTVSCLGETFRYAASVLTCISIWLHSRIVDHPDSLLQSYQNVWSWHCCPVTNQIRILKWCQPGKWSLAREDRRNYVLLANISRPSIVVMLVTCHLTSCTVSLLDWSWLVHCSQLTWSPSNSVS